MVKLCKEISARMCKGLISILCFIFSSACVKAQEGSDSFYKIKDLSSFELLAVAHKKTERIVTTSKPLSLFIFLSPECPLCQNYTKTLQQLRTKYNGEVNMYGIIPGGAYTIDDVNSFEKKYTTGFILYIDKTKQLTRYLGAVATPQAILTDQDGVIMYSGAIDDWVQGLGKKRIKASKHYLQDAIGQSLRYEQVRIKTTKAFGCKINDY